MATLIQRIVPIALLFCGVSFTPGCMTQSLYASKRIPLDMQGMPGPAPTIAVSMRYSTGWVHMFAMLNPEGVKQNKVEIVKIEKLSPEAPSLYVPADNSQVFWGSILTFIKSDFPGFALFKPGYAPTLWGPEYQHKTGLSVEWGRPAEGPIRARPETDQSASSSQPADQETQGLLMILDAADFWSQLQWRHTFGNNRDEIAIICQVVLDAANEYATKHGSNKWSAQRRQAISWCERLTKDTRK